MTFIPTPFTTGTDRQYCVVATQGTGRKQTRKDISGPLSYDAALDRAFSLRGDAYHKRVAAVPFPYKPKTKK
jgi:hypothetical protein